MFLFEDTLFSICHWFVNIELVANSPITHAWMTLIWQVYFLYKACFSFLHLGTVNNTPAVQQGGHFKSKIAIQKHKIVNNMALHVFQKGHSFTSMRAETRRLNVTLFDIIWECVFRAIKNFHHSAHAHKWPQKHQEYCLGLTKTFWQVGEFAYMGCENYEDWPYFIWDKKDELKSLQFFSLCFLLYSLKFFLFELQCHVECW